MKKLTNQELYDENLTLKGQVESGEKRLEKMKNDEERLRKEFAIAFSWESASRNFNASARDMLGINRREEASPAPSWSQIFVHIGRLLQQDDYSKMKESVETIRQGIEDINYKIDSK